MKSIDELTRNAVINYIRDEWRDVLSNNKPGGDCINAFVSGVEWERNRNKWISIEDELPPRNGNYNYSKRVLVTNGVECHIDEYNFTKNAWEFVDEFYLDITHISIPHWYD